MNLKIYEDVGEVAAIVLNNETRDRWIGCGLKASLQACPQRRQAQ